MKERQTRYYEITGFENDLDTLEKFLRHAEYLGKVGASRNLLLRVDGDGNGRINVKKADIDRKDILDVQCIDNDNYNIDQKESGATVGVYDIGE